jgi:predicted transcriptional regulator
LKSQVVERESSHQDGEYRKSNSKSKLELYVDILRALAIEGPMNLGQVMQQNSLSGVKALESLGFLVKLNLVKARKRKHESIYIITGQGEKVVRFFGKTAPLPSTINDQIGHQTCSECIR